MQTDPQAMEARRRLLVLIEQQALRVYEEAMKNPPVRLLTRGGEERR